MGRTYGSQSMVAPLRRVLVRTPGEAFGSADPEAWHYTGPPQLEQARREHAAFVDLLTGSGAEVIDTVDDPTESADSIYTHDPSLVTDAGAILLRMGKPLREPEPAEVADVYARLGIPIQARLQGDARAEGGDLLWLDRDLLAVGIGFRTNMEGNRQLAEALATVGAATFPVPLPYHEGPAACLHLMSLISMIDDDLAVVHRPLLPVPFLELLEQRGIACVEIEPTEFGSQAPNVLALGPRDCVMLEGNPETRRRLEAAGCRVRVYRGSEISLRAEGGPTCLTRPILRG